MRRLVKPHAEWATLGCLVVLAIASCLLSREGGDSYLKAESDSGRVGLPATPADEKAPPTATVVDTAGVTTEITDPTTTLSDFGGLPYGSVGLAVDVKEFTPWGSRGLTATYKRWLFFDQIESLSFGKAQTVTARLRTGATLSGKYGFTYAAPDLLGKSSDGQFELGLEKVKSVTFRGTGKKPDVPVEGEAAIVTLRSGEVLRAEDVRRYCIIPSRYINVSDHDEHYTSVWIKYKRGEGTVKKEIPFKQIKEIAFERPAPPPSSADDHGPRCKISLVDGSTLSGACIGDDSHERFEYLVGRTDLGPFEVSGHMSAAIQSIAFSR